MAGAGASAPTDSIGAATDAPGPITGEVQGMCLGARLLERGVGGWSPSWRLLGRLLYLEVLEEWCDVMEDAEEVSDISI